MSGIEKRIHVDDNGVVEFCVADFNCPYGSFENVSEAWAHYQKRPKKSSREIELPRGFKTVQMGSYARSGGVYIYKDAIPSERLFEFAEKSGYEIVELSATPDQFVFKKKNSNEKIRVYASRIKDFKYELSDYSYSDVERFMKRTKFSSSQIINLSKIVAYFQGYRLIYGDGYLLMAQAYEQALKNFEEKKDWNWRESFLDESVTLSMAIEHAGSRLQDVRNRDDVSSLGANNHTVLSFLKLCAEIINRTDILSEQTIKIFGSNDDEVIGDLLREAIRH